MALSRSIITQAIHHQPPIKAKYNNYLVLRVRAPPRYVSSVHVPTVSELRSNKLPSNRGRNDTAAPCPAPLSPWPHPPPVTPLQLCPQLPVVTCPPKQFSIQKFLSQRQGNERQLLMKESFLNKSLHVMYLFKKNFYCRKKRVFKLTFKCLSY